MHSIKDRESYKTLLHLADKLSHSSSSNSDWLAKQHKDIYDFLKHAEER
ncbi:hypothetical protein ACMXYR_14590 [Neptuniibacter sp. QD29_5]